MLSLHRWATLVKQQVHCDSGLDRELNIITMMIAITITLVVLSRGAAASRFECLQCY